MVVMDHRSYAEFGDTFGIRMNCYEVSGRKYNAVFLGSGKEYRKVVREGEEQSIIEKVFSKTLVVESAFDSTLANFPVQISSGLALTGLECFSLRLHAGCVQTSDVESPAMLVVSAG